MALLKLEDIVQQEDAMATEFCDDKIISKNVFAMKIYCFMMKTKIRMKKVCDKNLKTQIVIKLKSPNCSTKTFVIY